MGRSTTSSTSVSTVEVKIEILQELELEVSLNAPQYLSCIYSTIRYLNNPPREESAVCSFYGLVILNHGHPAV